MTDPAGALTEMAENDQYFGVVRWAAWPQADSPEEKPDIQFVPPLLRRRLSRLGSMALAVTQQCLGDERGIPVVFASQHGELNRTAEILVDLARNEPPSPTAFSLSVHNAAVGLLGLIRGDRAAGTAIAAGPATLAMGLMETMMQAGDAGGSALLVFADEGAPELYANLAGTNSYSLALAVLVDVTREGFRLGWANTETTDAPCVDQARDLFETLRGVRRRAVLGDATQAWQVTADARAA